MQIVNVSSASDGTGSTPTGASMVRNDTYYLEKIAERYIKEQGASSGLSCKLAHLPTGYAGYERAREGSKHVDRYLYGHPNGVFRSVNELYPHWKHLQDFGGSVGCPCKLCAGLGKGSKKRQSESNSIASGSPSERSAHFGPTSYIQKTVPKAISNSVKPQAALRHDNPQGLPQGRLDSESPAPARGNPTDEEGTPDVYRKLINQLKQEAGSEDSITMDIVEQLSPDWKAGNELLQDLLTEWQSLPSFVPRVGELVLFARNASDDSIAWDFSSQTLRRVARESRSWLDRLEWEAGVVTQMPIEPIGIDDIKGVPDGKKQNVAYYGFRVEPISKPSHQDKTWTQQHKYVPIHAIRPFSFWKECVGGLAQVHPTIRHALTVASSFCLIGKYSFKGTWPEATLFLRALYLGPELIMVGDAVRLAPTDAKGLVTNSKYSVTDIMVVSSIRLRFLNLDQASENDYDHGQPYKTCLHVCGKTFTLDPKRSSDGIAKAPVKPEDLPVMLRSQRQWFYADSQDKKAKLEVPFSRVIGRCFEGSAVKSWFATPADMLASSTFKAVNAPANKARVHDILHGLEAAREARKYSREHDSRIDSAAEKSWFWAESRVEQLDLHEVNGAFVGVKDETRSKKQLNTWRQALKAMEGKQGASQAYMEARKQRIEEEKSRQSAQVNSSSWGLMGSAAKLDSTDGDAKEDDPMEEDAMEGSAEAGDGLDSDGMGHRDAMDTDGENASRQSTGPGRIVDLTLDMDDDDDDDMDG